MKHGDFTALAGNYAKYRPGYAPRIVQAVLSLTSKSPSEVRFADVGAGTGLWTRMLAAAGASGVAVEPNDAMREQGRTQSDGLAVEWKSGTGEDTGLNASSFDVVSMASSFHWTDFARSTREFHRLLKPGGMFVALWNPRMVELNPLLVDIEQKLKALVPELKRVSSGRSDFTSNLTDRLVRETDFKDVLYLEGRHTELQSQERYIGLWESVNDVRVQAGEERFSQFVDYIRAKTSPDEPIAATYLTRAWIAFR